jgi:glycosyltransferase involved in cell wall biosynthesis
MRIGIDANPVLNKQPGGIEVYIAELVKRMPRLGHSHDFLLYFNFLRKQNMMMVQRFVQNGVQTKIFHAPRRFFWPIMWNFKIPVDWIIGHVDVMFYPSFVVLPQRRGKRVLTVHDLIPMTHPELCDPSNVRDFQLYVPHSVPRADKIIVVSNYTRDHVMERFRIKPEVIHVIPNGVHERFQPQNGSVVNSLIQSRYGIQGPFFLFIGYHEPRKNLVRMVKAFEKEALKSPVQEFSLVLAGSPAYGAEELYDIIAKLDPRVRVLLPGYIAYDDLPILYGAATAFIFPSIVEGFGIPVLEAMACGCPVLTSCQQPLSEIVGDAALTVDPLDVDAIAEGFKCLAENSALRQTLKVRGLERVKEFSWERTAVETLKVLEEA